MFDFVQEKKRLVQIILAAIILTFAFWGVESYQRSSNVEAPASVNGSKITQQEFENTLNQQKNRLREKLGAQFDPAMFDNPEMRRSVLENLIAQRVLILRAKASGLTVNDEQVSQVIQGIEAFQENGQFNKKLYQAALARQNLSPLGFEARLRDDLLGQQMRNAYVLNGFAPDRVVDNVIRLNEQQRVISVSRISPQAFLAESKVDEAELKKYYEQNQKEFQTPEQVKVEFVKFSVDDLIGSVKVSTDEIRQYYDGHQGDFGTQEQRQAAHILIAAAATAPQVEQDAAKTKAGQLLQQLRQNPAKFAELAKSNSQDPGSAVNGGDLGFFGKGMMVKPFEDAAFALKQGEISELVKSDYGYHIIKVLAIKPSRVLPFDEARETIANKLRQQRAADIFIERAEKFNNIVYEQSDTLKPAANLVEAKIEQSGWLVKGAAAAQPWTPKMLQAIFADDVIKDKRNTAAIEVAANTLVAARVLEYKPAAIRTLSEVQDGIRQKLLLLQASKLAAEHGKKTLEQLQRGEKPAVKWEAAQNITHAQHGALDAGLARKIFQVNKAKLPQYAGAEAALNGYVLVRIDEIKDDAKVDDAKRARYMQQLRQLTGEEMFLAYLEDAKQQAEIKMKLSAISKTEP